MKKEDGISLIVYALMIAIAFVVGFCFLRPLIEGVQLGWGIILLFLIASIILSAALLEISHLIGAKIGKYKILSVNILGLCLYRKENKWKFKFSNFDGITGETKIYPKNEKASPKPFAFAPLFSYLIIFVILMTLFFVFTNIINEPRVGVNYTALKTINVLIIIFVTIGGMLELYNIFPAKLDSTTDGYRLRVLTNKKNLVAYNELLRIEGAYTTNTPIDNMMVFDDINDFTSIVNLYTIYKYLDEGKIKEAGDLLDKIIINKDKVSKDTYCSALAQKMYLVLMYEDFEVARKYYEEHVKQTERRYISNDLSMQAIRSYILISSMLDISEHETRYAINRVNKALKRTLSGRVNIEKKLYEAALNKVDQVRPEWHIKEKEVK